MTVEFALSPAQLSELADLIAAKLESNRQQDQELRFYSIEEAAQILGVDADVVYALAARGNGWRKIGRLWRISHEDLQKLGIEQRKKVSK